MNFHAIINHLCLALLLMICIALNSCQKEIVFGGSDYKRTIKYRDSTLYFFVSNKDSPKLKNHKLYYSWYKGGQIGMSQGAFIGDLLHGEYTVLDSLDFLKRKGQYDRGLKDGIWLTWDRQGNLTSILHYKKGRLEGKQLFLHSDGSELRINYRRGRKHGKSISIDPFNRKTRKESFKYGFSVGKPKIYNLSSKDSIKTEGVTDTIDFHRNSSSQKQIYELNDSINYQKTDTMRKKRENKNWFGIMKLFRKDTIE